MALEKQMGFRWTAAPANNGFAVVFDSTYGSHNMTWAGVASGSAFLAPGPMRAQFGGATIRYTVKATTNNVTLDEQVLTGNAGTSADWESQGTTGSAVTITAGTTATREFKPLSPDWRIMITAGATAPTALVVQGDVMFSPNYGG